MTLTATPPRTILTVESGLHRGATVELTRDEYLIGSAEDCDIVLRDAQVASHHCRIVRDWSGVAVRDALADNPRTFAPKNVTYHEGTIGAEYDLGGVEISLRQFPTSGAYGMSDAFGRPASRWLLSGVAAVFLLSIGTAATVGRANKHSRAAPNPATSALKPTARTQLPANLLEQVKLAVADRNLQIALLGGRLRITGSTSDPRVKDRIRALAADLQAEVPVEDASEYLDRQDPAVLPVRLSSVKIGNPSYFLTDSGEHYFVGGVLPDGAEVVAIGADEIRFQRGGRVIVYQVR